MKNMLINCKFIWRFNFSLVLMGFLVFNVVAVPSQLSIYQSVKNYFNQYENEIKDLISKETFSSLPLKMYTSVNQDNSTQLTLFNLKIENVTHNLNFYQTLYQTTCEFLLFSNKNQKPTTTISFGLSYEYINASSPTHTGTATFIMESSAFNAKKSVKKLKYKYTVDSDVTYAFSISAKSIDNENLNNIYTSALNIFITEYEKEVNDYLNSKFNDFYQTYILYPYSLYNSDRTNTLDMSVVRGSVCSDSYLINFYKGSATSMWNKTYNSDYFTDFPQDKNSEYQFSISFESLNDILSAINPEGITFKLDSNNSNRYVDFSLNVQSLGNIIPEIYELYTRNVNFIIECKVNFLSISPLGDFPVLEYNLNGNVLVKGKEIVLSFDIRFISKIRVIGNNLQLEIFSADIVNMNIKTEFNVVYKNQLALWATNSLSSYFLKNPYKVFNHPYNTNACTNSVAYLNNKSLPSNRVIIVACSTSAVTDNNQKDSNKNLKYLEFMK